MRIQSIREIAPEPARCIEVDSQDRLFAAGGSTGVEYVSHNSVVQRSIIFGTIMRPESWRFIGIDLKKVELSAFRAYSNVVLGIATTLEDALTCLRFAQQTMMKRYADMEKRGVNNFLDLPEKSQALMVMVDEAGELLSPSGVKALSENTYVPNLNGRKNLRELQVGDIVYDCNYEETRVERKYEPIEQDTYRLTISQDSTGQKEEFIAGAEHYWVVQVDAMEQLMTTEDLYELFQKTPAAERAQIKFRRQQAPANVAS